jgi:hypothetical protein
MRLSCGLVRESDHAISPLGAPNNIWERIPWPEVMVGDRKDCQVCEHQAGWHALDV